MRLVADENVHGEVVRLLRQAGYVVRAMAEDAPGCSDVDILGQSDMCDSVLVTYDRDFGRLIFAERCSPPLGIIYARLGRAEPRHVAQRILALLAIPLPPHHLATIDRDDDRLTPFPHGALHG